MSQPNVVLGLKELQERRREALQGGKHQVVRFIEELTRRVSENGDAPAESTSSEEEAPQEDAGDGLDEELDWAARSLVAAAKPKGAVYVIPTVELKQLRRVLQQRGSIDG